jgi:type II secretory pathway component PulJ
MEAQSDRGELMQATLQTLTEHLTNAARLAFGSYLPSSPLTGLGRVSELAAQHPAFIMAPDTPRGA